MVDLRGKVSSTRIGFDACIVDGGSMVHGACAWSFPIHRPLHQFPSPQHSIKAKPIPIGPPLNPPLSHQQSRYLFGPKPLNPLFLWAPLVLYGAWVNGETLERGWSYLLLARPCVVLTHRLDCLLIISIPSIRDSPIYLHPGPFWSVYTPRLYCFSFFRGMLLMSFRVPICRGHR